MINTPVAAIDPIAPYLGGKRNLAATLTEIIHRVPHVTYAEVFIGMGGVFFRRRQRPRAEVINDYSRDVATLFRILQRHYQQFLDVLKWQVTSRADFERLVTIDPCTLTDLERAARFLYLQRLAFGGKITGRNFGVDVARSARFDLTKLVPMLEDVHERLAAVTIECLDYKDFIERYDMPGTLFYLDPPYYGCEKDYGADAFSREEFPVMAQELAKIKGRFILSLNDCPEVRQMFSGFYLRTVETLYTIAADGPKAVSEVIISNFEDIFVNEQRELI